MLAIIAGLDLQRWRPYIVTHLPAYQETGVPVDCILYICYVGHGYSGPLSPASRALPADLSVHVHMELRHERSPGSDSHS